MKIMSLIILSILDWCIYSTISIPFIKKLGGKALRLLPMFFLLTGLNMLDLVFGEAYPQTAYSAIVCYTVLTISIYFALGKSLSLAVVICGICILIGLPLEIISVLILPPLGIDISQMEYYPSSILIMSEIFFLVILVRITLLPVLVRVVVKRADFLKNQALIIINGLFAFSIFKQYLNFSGVPYYLYPLPLALFLTGIVFVYREMMDDRNLKSMLEQYQNNIDSIQPIIQDIRSKQHDFKNQINVLKLNLQINEHNNDQNLAELVETLNRQLIPNDNFLMYSIQTLGALMYIKYHEAAKLGIKLTVENNMSKEDLLATALNELTIISLIANLIDNSIQACSEFKGTKEVNVNIRMEQRELQISVKNTGEPIPDSVMQKIFMRGFSTKHNQGNEPHGYGLYNVQKLIEKVSGRIEIISGSETTTFLLIIPTSDFSSRI